MYELAYRIGMALLFLAGLATLATIVAPQPQEAAGLALVLHWRVLVALLASALVLSAVWPALRMPAITAALLSKTALVTVCLAVPGTAGLPEGALGSELGSILLLLVAATIFIARARLEARWEAVPYFRQES